MTNEEFQKLVLEKLTDMSTEIKDVRQNLGSEIQSLGVEIKDVKQSIGAEIQDVRHALLRIEQDHSTKLAALFDGYALRGEQIERLQESLEDRLDAIQNDLSYVVSKVAQHDRNIVQLQKATRTSILAAAND